MKCTGIISAPTDKEFSSKASSQNFIDSTNFYRSFIISEKPQGRRHGGNSLKWGIPIVQRGIVSEIYPYIDSLASLILGQKYITQRRSE
jgi:hypothetical protein